LNKDDFYHREASRKDSRQGWIQIYDETAGKALSNISREEEAKMKETESMETKSFTFTKDQIEGLKKMGESLKVNKSKLARDAIDILLAFGPDNWPKLRQLAARLNLSIPEIIIRIVLDHMIRNETHTKLYGVPLPDDLIIFAKGEAVNHIGGFENMRRSHYQSQFEQRKALEDKRWLIAQRDVEYRRRYEEATSAGKVEEANKILDEWQKPPIGEPQNNASNH
jgi:hypothetical protein